MEELIEYLSKGLFDPKFVLEKLKTITCIPTYSAYYMIKLLG